MAGLTTEGFIAETFESIRDQISARLRAEFGAGLPLDESTIEGQSWDILVEQLVIVWELMETLYSSLDPDKATAAGLDALCLLTGTFRRPPTFGIGAVTLTGDPATDVAAGQDVRIGSDGAVATTYEDATLAAVDAYAAGDDAAGDLVTAGGNVYYAFVGGTNGGVAPTHTVRPYSMASPHLISLDGGVTFIDVTDGDVVWIWVGVGAAAAADVKAVAVETGPVNYPSFAIDEIVTPLIGLSGVGNALDFDLGLDLQSDESLRESREANLSAPGTSTRDAIRAALLDLEGVVSVTTFVNNGNVTDADGVPAHSIEALIRGGADQDIRDCLLANVAAGIDTYGNTSGAALDSEGTSHQVKFSRPEEILIYVALTLTYDAKKYPADGDAAVAQSVVDFGDAQDTGKDAVVWGIAATPRDVDGVLKVSSCLISTTPGPTLANDIAITLRQLAVFDTSRVTVASSPATP